MAYCLQVISSEKTSDGLKALAMGLVVYNYQAVDVSARKGLMWDLGLWSGFPIFQQKSSNYRNFVGAFSDFENKNLELSEG